MAGIYFQPSELMKLSIEIRRAQELDPLSLVINTELGAALLLYASIRPGLLAI